MKKIKRLPVWLRKMVGIIAQVIVKLDEENQTSASLAQENGRHNCTGRHGW
jgi:hypothetical protein